MAKEPYRIDEYSFTNREEYERALKEKETVTYLQANTGSNDNKALLKIYNRSVEKKSFHTVIGTEYLSSLRRQLIASGIVTDETLAPVPITRTASSGNRSERPDQSLLERQVARYKAAYESARTGRIIKNLTILILLVVIVAILLITYQSRYSVFTYFTNYKEDMREELIDEYVDWENQLEQKEQELNDREAALQNQEP
ncbi:MAG: hypothetical protein K2J67_06420 [Lachnospiraceae bacterium]|nr:hypothetical protein [Lachnospiraceae bacterium]